MTENPSRIALFLQHLGGGGAEAVMIHLARGLIEQGLKVDFILSQAEGPHLQRIPPTVNVINLGQSGTLASLAALIRYLRQTKPTALLSAMHFNNEIAIAAKHLAGVPTRVIVSEHNTLSQRSQHETRRMKQWTPTIAKLFYPWADKVVAVSHGVARDLAKLTTLHADEIQVIYNPAITPELSKKAKEPLEHPWFRSGEPPVILGVGKLEPQKDFATLIRAFAQVRATRAARLVILGWGPDPERRKLEALVAELGLTEDVDLPGYVTNPYMYMARAAVFVLSSRWEGLPLVLVEAIAVGTAVVATDCESGPAEILAQGKYGTLTPVGNQDALATAILSVLSGESKPVELTWLKQFELEVVTQQYLEVLT